MNFKMNIYIWVLLISAIFINNIAGKSTNQEDKEDKEKKEKKSDEVWNYVFNVQNNTERKSLYNICENHPELKSCVLAKAESTNGAAAPNIKPNNKKCRDLGEIQITEDGSYITATIEATDETEEIHERKKRSTVINPCLAQQSHVSKVYIYVYDSNDNQVELYFDASEHVYRTFYIYECDQQYNTPGYVCEPQHIMVKAAVFPDEFSYTPVVRNVKIPATCVLMQ